MMIPGDAQIFMHLHHSIFYAIRENGNQTIRKSNFEEKAVTVHSVDMNAAVAKHGKYFGGRVCRRNR